MSPVTSSAAEAAPLSKSGSTGPRTEEGKRRSSLNALRHGLTGRVVVMPGEDMAAYQAFSKELFTSLAPETPVENQFAQTFVDTQWRLNRIRSIEDGMFALGHFEAIGEIDVNDSQVHAALTAARVFRDDSKAFVNLSLYEQRMQRTLRESLRQLQALQSERLARRQAALAAAVALHNLKELRTLQENTGEADGPMPTQTPKQFVFSTPEVGAEASPHRDNHRRSAPTLAA